MLDKKIINKSDCYTCFDLLQASSMRGAKLLTKNVDLNIPVKSINIMEVPDIEDWTHPGEFLITTGYPFKDNKNRLFELIGSLSKIKVAALGIKLHRFIDEISPEVIDYAQTIGFPIIQLSPQANFSNIVQEVTKNILTHDMESVIALQNQAEVLINKISQGESLENILSSIEDIMGYGALLIGSEIKPILGKNAKEILGEEYINFSETLTSEMKEYTDISGHIHKLKKFPIYWGNNSNVTLVLIGDNLSFKKTDNVLISQIKNVLSLELHNRISIEKLKHKYRNRFLQRLLSGKMTNEADIYLEAKSYNYPIDIHIDYTVVVAHILDEQNLIKSKLFRFCNKSHLGETLMTAVFEGNVVIIIPNNSQIKEQLLSLSSKWAELFNETSISFCISKPYPVTKLHIAYQEAVKILRISRRCGITNQFISADDLGVYSVLALIPKSKAVSQFIQSQLSTLKEYDEQHRSMLCKTLKIFLQKDCNIKETAEALFTHYNTIIYRLERITQILNIDLNDVEVKFALTLAMKLDDMQSEQCDLEEQNSSAS